MKKVYLNIENPESEQYKKYTYMAENGEHCEVIRVGKDFAPSVMTCEENGFLSLQRKRGIYLIFEGNLPKVDFFPVPMLTLFAKDMDGGFFAYAEKDGQQAVYYVSAALECWYLAKDLREFVQMAVFEPQWKEKVTGISAEYAETEKERADLGMVFGLYPPQDSILEKVYREDAFMVYENEENARRNLCIL